MAGAAAAVSHVQLSAMVAGNGSALINRADPKSTPRTDSL
jgi:hypothetical protein